MAIARFSSMLPRISFQSLAPRDWSRLLPGLMLVVLSGIFTTAEAQTPSVSSAANQTFTVGDAATAISTITITDDAVTPTITGGKGGKDIRIRIPSGFNMTWDTGITTVTVGGPAAGKINSNLRPYEDGDQTLVIDVSADFAAGDQVTISGLQFTSFSAVSPADNLELEVNNDDVVSATDDKTVTINPDLAPSISSAADQVFTVGDAATATSTITITDHAVTPTITDGNDLRIRIPSSFNMSWDTSITTVTLGGPQAGKVSATLLAYEDGNQTLVLNVTSDFVAGDQITVTDPQFISFSAASAADNLELETNDDGVISATNDKTITINSDPALSISSAADQVFAVGDAATAISTITITDDAVTPTITGGKGGNDIRVRIPSGFNMTWDTSIDTVTAGGPAAGKINSNLRPYEDGDQTLVIDVSADFAAGDQVTISGPQFTSFSAVSPADNLELEVNDDDVVSATDDKTVTINPDLAPSISSAADQVFIVGDAATATSTITITDHAVTPTITDGNDLRIRIPSSFNMSWDTSIATVTLGGPQAGKVSTTLLAYEDGNQTLVLNVTSDFVAGDQITVSGPQFISFSAASPADNLELEVNDDGVISATNDKTITISSDPVLSISSAADQVFAVGDAATAISTITITDDAVTPTITGGKGGKDIRVRIPAGFNMIWDTSIDTVTAGGPAAGKINSNLRPYEDGDKTLVIDVSADFAAGDQVTLSGPQFTSFSAVSPADNLELEVNNDDVVSATDDKTVTITIQALSLVKKAFLADGTPVPSGTSVPKETVVKYLIYLNNIGGVQSDVSVRDVLDPVFLHQAGTLKVNNSTPACALLDCTAAEEATIFSDVDATAAKTDAVDGDEVSITGSTIDAGNEYVANGVVNAAAASVWVLLVEVKVQ